MSSPTVGPILIMLGLGLALVGVLVWAGAFGWFGRLPGDIRIERGTVHVYIPIVSMLVVSIALTLLLNLIRRLF